MKNILILISAIVVTSILCFFIIKLVNKNKKTNPEIPTTENTIPSNESTFLKKSGKEVATTENPVRAYLDPLKTYVRVIGEGEALIVLENNQNQSIIADENTNAGIGIEKWWAMPAGIYLVYPRIKKEIIFYWSEEKPNF